MILSRYLHLELLRKTFWITVLVILIFSSNRLAILLRDAVAGSIPANLIAGLIGSQLVLVLPKILPATLMLAVFLTFRRLSRQHELLAISAGGAGIAWQLKTSLGFAVAIALIVALLTLWLAPMAGHHSQMLRMRASQELSLSAFSEQQFHTFDNGSKTLFLQRLSPDRQSAEDIFMHSRESGETGISISASGRITVDPASGLSFITLLDGRNYRYTTGQLDYQITRYQRYSILMDKSLRPKLQHLKTSSLYFSTLRDSDKPEHIAERHWRYGLIIACLLLTAFAVLANQSAHSGAGMPQMVFTLMTYLIYSNLLVIGTSLLKRGVVPGWIGLWWVHLLMLGTVMLMLCLPVLSRQRMAGTKPMNSHA